MVSEIDSGLKKGHQIMLKAQNHSLWNLFFF